MAIIQESRKQRLSSAEGDYKGHQPLFNLQRIRCGNNLALMPEGTRRVRFSSLLIDIYKMTGHGKIFSGFDLEDCDCYFTADTRPQRQHERSTSRLQCPRPRQSKSAVPKTASPAPSPMLPSVPRNGTQQTTSNNPRKLAKPPDQRNFVHPYHFPHFTLTCPS
jgi:hypothetical protein